MTAADQLALTMMAEEPIATVADGRVSVTIDRATNTVSVVTRGVKGGAQGATLRLRASTCTALMAALGMAVNQLKKPVR